MNNLKDFLTDLYKRGIHLFVEQGKLKSRAEAGAITAEIGAQIKAHKEAIIALLEQTQAAQVNNQRIEKAPQDAKKPLSFSQQSLWMLDHIGGGSSHYNIPGALKFTGDLNVDALQNAFATIIERHESLRTYFVYGDDEQPEQVVHDGQAFAVEMIDLSEISADDIEQELKQRIEKEAQTPFDFSKDLMLRAQLLKLNEQSHVLLFTMHHIASDGWSMGVLVQELKTLYSAYSQGQNNPLAPLAIQYSDYAYWQRNWLQGEVLEQQLDYWGEQLKDLPEVHQLPLDRNRPKEQTFDGDLYVWLVDKGVKQQLKALCQRQDATMFMVIHAAFSALLAQYSSETDIVVGSPIANREQSEVEALIGFFVNTLVLRSDLSENPTFTQLIEQSKAMLLGAYKHQQVPFEQLVDKLKPARNLAYSPLFQIMLVLQNNEQGALELPDVQLEVLKQEEKITSKYDITLNVTEVDRGLILGWEFNTNLFDRSTIESLSSHFEQLLSSLVTAPEQPVLAANMLTDAERQLELSTWQAKETFDTPHCIHALFEQQAQLHPDATALVFDAPESARQSLTYQQLNERANQLAHYLLAQKQITPDTLVGVCADRSLDMLVAILATLKAGGAYVPLDPAHPESRLRHIIEDSAIEMVLTQSHLVKLPGFEHIDTVCLDDDVLLNTVAQYPVHNIPASQLELTPSNLAYVIYTSGSTGLPKGVLVEHQNVCRLFDATEFGFSFGADDVWTMFHSFAFDFSVWEIWGALVYGGTLVVVPKEVARSTSDFYQLLVDEQVTVLNQTPTAFAQLVSVALENVQPLALRYVVFGGEALNLQSLHAWVNQFGDDAPQLINMYGITETTVHASFKRITREDITSKGEASMIGVPLRDLDILLLNAQKNLVPVGVVGEMYVGGAGVTRGYLNRPELTAERFIDNPFYDQNDALSSPRLYRSGDLARRMPDGSLEYLGRIDNQVKIRGFRIELGEIEHALLCHEQVNDAVVLAKQTDNGDKRLVAYVASDVVSHGDEQQVKTARFEFTESLRLALSDSLPEYMVPQLFVILDKLPLTGNGKVDTKALPEPDVSAQQGQYVAPRNDVEAALCTIWQEVLRVEQVGITDNFFKLGGDSILSIQVVSRAVRAGLHFSVKALFSAQTIEKLAPVVKSGGKVLASQEAVTGSQVLLPIDHVFFADETDLHHYNQSVLLTTPVDFDSQALPNIVAKLYERHDALRLQFAKQDDAWQGEYAPLTDELIAQAVITKSWSNSSFDNLHDVASAYQESLNPEKGQLLKAVYFAPETAMAGRLLIVIHHLAVDGVSWRVLLEDIEKLYGQWQNGETLKLESKTSSYQQWGEFLAEYAHSSEVTAQRDYWLEGFAVDVAPLHQVLPKADTSAQGASSVNFELPAQLTEQLLRHSNSAYRTQINELLLSAILLGAHHTADVNAVRLDLEGHGREELSDKFDLSQTVGWFTTIFPLTLSMQAGASLEDLICAVKEQYRAIPQKGIGYGLLRYCAQDEAFAQLPASEMVFNYLGQFDQVANDDSAFGKANEFAGNNISAARKPSNPLTINCMISEGRLQGSLTFTKALYSTQSMQTLCDNIVGALSQIIEHCMSVEHGRYTPSDFPLANVQDQELQQWIGATDVADLYPAVGMQQGLLFHSMLHSGSFVVQNVLRFEHLDCDKFKQAWHQVAQRHNVFRTSFVGMDSGNVHQVVHAQVSIPWLEEDLSQLDGDAQKAKLEAYRQADQQRGFTPEEAPLMRFRVLHMGNDVQQVIWSYHHALMDGWCIPLVIGEVTECYRALLKGEQANLRAVRSYHDYAAWLAQQDPQQAIDYWTKTLASIAQPTALPLLSSEEVAASTTEEHDDFSIIFDSEQTEKLVALAQSSQSTVNLIVQAAWALLLARYNGTDQVTFGAVTSGRPPELDGVEEIIGLFINSLPVVVNIDESLSVEQWLAQLHQQQIERESYNHVPLHEIQQLSAHEHALFDSLIVFENYPVDDAIDEKASDAALNLQEVESYTGTNYGITLVADLARTLSIKFEVRRGLLAQSQIEQIAQHLQELILNFAKESASPITRIGMLNETQLTHQLVDLNNNMGEYPEDVCMHQLFEAQAAKVPDAIALEFESQQLSFAQLNQRANRLAHLLIESGAEHGDCVGIYLERSIEMMIAILAVMKAGATYVPMEPNGPVERAQMILEDANVDIVLLHSDSMESLPIKGIDVLLMDDASDDEQWLEEYSDDNPDVDETQVTPQSLAYILFTSGSTGRPKGVMVPHQGLVNYLTHAHQQYLTPTMSGSIVSSPLCFDATITTLLTPLCVGKTVTLLADNDETLSLLSQQLMSDSPKLFKITPAHLMALAYMQNDDASSNAAHTIVIGGEQLTVQTLTKWKSQLLPNASFVNEYGPTETVVGCSTYTVNTLEDLARCEHAVLIGKPILNTNLYVINAGRIAPFGASGELYIGGAGVTQGYLAREQLSAEKFVTHTFEDGRTERLYRTGDLVCYRDEGNLEFIGRIDEQFKLRGYRIEPGEIENLLNKFAGVDESLVMLVGEGEEQHLAAYLVCTHISDKEALEHACGGQISEYLEDKVPSYMVPSTYYVLEEFPVTLNGKIDRKALPAQGGMSLQVEVTALQTDTEHWLAQMWQDILGTQEIGASTDFFKAGGHSLLAMRFISALAKQKNVEITLNALFEHSILADLAAHIDAQARQEFVAIKPVDRAQPLPLSYPQRRLWFIDKFGQGSAQYNMPIAIRLKGRLDETLLESVFTQIIERHEVLRTTYHDHTAGPVQVIAKEHGFKMKRHDLSAMAVNSVEQDQVLNQLVAQEAAKPFDLSQDLMLRVNLVVLSEQEYVVQFVMHHIASDGWSLDIIVNEFVELYRAGYQGVEAQLSLLPVQYADFAHWQVTDYAEQQLADQLGYWTQQLAGVPQLHNLPLDKSRPAKQQFAGGGYDDVIDGALLEQLQSVAKANGVTLFMVLYSAFALLLGRYSNEKDIVIGSPVAGRTHPDVESLIGFFVNTLVFRTQLNEQHSFTQLLNDNKGMILDAFAHQDVPFEMLVDELNIPRNLSHAPLFQVIFTMQNRGDGRIELPELELGNLPSASAQSKFDLELVITEQDDKLFINWIYAKSLFEQQSIEALGHSFKHLLTQIAAAPEQTAYDYQLLDESQTHWLAAQNDTAEQNNGYDSVIKWFENQVDAHPQQCALESGELSLTFSELDAKANQLAHALTEQGVKSGHIVGLCAPRGVEQVVAVLATLKCGAAYLPLEPSLPQARLDYMATDSGAQLVLVDSALAQSHTFTQCATMELAPLQAYDAYPQSRLALADDASQSLCYIIYTSGSTGLPKGVMVHNSGVVNYLQHTTENYFAQHLSGAILSSPLSFDATVTTLFTAFLCGSKLVVLPESQEALVKGLHQYLSAQQSYLFKLTPAHLELLNSAKVASDAQHVIVIGGEQLKTSTLLPWKASLLPNSVYVNEYGPTETVVGCCVYWVRTLADINVDMPAIPIGQAIRNTQLHIIKEGQAAGLGAIGELYIAGHGVTLGYLNRDDLTAEKFITSHRALSTEQKLYRSGDLVRYRPDGNLEFVGRIDDQLKIRGYRIETGEIEQQLSAYEGVKEAVVVAVGEGNEAALVAYYVPQAQAIEATKLTQWMKRNLPDYMVPAQFIMVNQFVLTANGKVDKKSLPSVSQAPAGNVKKATASRTVNSITQQLKQIWSEVLGVEKVASKDNFFELGGNSMLSVQVQKMVSERTDFSIELVDIFEYPTIAGLAAYLSGEEEAYEQESYSQSTVERDECTDIAIIGMSGRFPGAKDVEQFWQNISQGVESIQHYDEQQLQALGFSSQVLNNPNFVKSGYVLEGIEEFDANYFGYSPREAELLDPQQRLLLECSTEALELSGYGDDSQYRNVGVYVGIAESNYLLNNIMPNPEVMAGTGKSTFFGNSSGFASTLISYKLNLTGPSINVLTACSTSLVAVHQACNSIMQGECEMALAGGASINLLQPGGYMYEEGGIVSADGHCRPFDKDAKGTRAGSGAGVLLLKRLDKALADNDTIHAVIKGSAINNDASDKVGYTAPSVRGQSEVIKQALKNANVTAESIEYVEAHGTGTQIGDPIEVKALQKAYASADKGQCALGTLKANVGHLDSAAGVASMIKVIQAMKHQQLPPSINYTQSNSQINFADTPFYINTELKPWQGKAPVRRAGVSSFGIGGTNAHVILEEAPRVDTAAKRDTVHVLPLSAMSKEALKLACDNLREHLLANQDANLADVAYTLQVGRKVHEYRTSIACRTVDEAIALLAQKPRIVREKQTHRSTVFMFPGQGAQYQEMAKALYEQSAVFKAQFDECAQLLNAHLDVDIKDVVFGGTEQAEDALLNQTQYTQPALFVVEYCTAKLLQSWGVQADAMIGHSIGEYVAACLANVFSLADALKLVSARGRIMAQAQPGDMVSVVMPEAQLQPLLTRAGACLASVNAQGNCVAAGSAEAIAQLTALLDAQQVQWRMLRTSHAFHSAMMDDVLDTFKSEVEQVTLSAPTQLFVSNVTGQFIEPQQAQDPQYWVDHLRGTVRFAAGIDTLLAETMRLDEHKVLLEVGPGIGLGTLARKHENAKEQVVLATIRHPNEAVCDLQYLAGSLGKLWSHGIAIDWSAYHQDAVVKRVPLPTYPFEKRRFWIDRVRSGASTKAVANSKLEPQNWWYVPTWQQTPVARQVSHAVQSDVSRWLLIADEQGLADVLAQQLSDSGHAVMVARHGAAFSQVDEYEYRLDMASQSQYGALIKAANAAAPLDRVVHMGALSEASEALSLSAFNHAQSRGALSALYTIQAIVDAGLGAQVQVDLLSRDVFSVTGWEMINPDNAAVGALVKVASQEYSELLCHHIDISETGPSHANKRAALSKMLCQELLAAKRIPAIAIRGNKRWEQKYQAELMEPELPPAHTLKDNGTYIITGGLGNIGLLLAEHISSSVNNARIVLLGRSEFAHPSQWDDIVAQQQDATLVSRIRQIQTMQANGAEVVVMAADVAELAQMRHVFNTAIERFGAVDGVVHCAGQIHGSMKALSDTTLADFAQQCRSKVDGLLVLEQLLSEHQVGFCLAMSSLSTVLGGLGFSAYASANAYMDAFVQRQHAQGDTRWLSVNWDGWKFDVSNDNVFAMNPQEGAQAFAMALAGGYMPQLINSTGSLEARLSQWIDKTQETNKNLYARPDLETDYVKPRNDVEEQLVDIWRDILGIEEIGIEDHFFDLGGDSLVATRVISAIRQTYSIPERVFSIKDFFDNPVIEAIAEKISKGMVDSDVLEAKEHILGAGKAVEEGVF
ncbi:non-ribosomal peptide synthetase/type I polyketide synthase [Pseudoalteromonas sp. S16_S37]|uniref:non-ribosomal peptide synthetase/type I polyketide synthase n=1 Tax=Pseudoalteromonas sp. S16_S37 TaxID=2720228 RepID=UPI001680587E|nr:non-ribosomal peptide synthetase/type I polyketide synthase [Pseudoalteromonas sp. S16_S37]MBD1581824.1 amino acid adenylation domain-containing protein [Pseudoalteromonas sp. S16_S37]